MVLGIWAAGSGVGEDHVWSLTSGQLRSICQRTKHNGCNRWVEAYRGCSYGGEMKHSGQGYGAP